MRLKRIVEETQRMLDGGAASAYTVQQTVRSVQVDVKRLQRRHQPRAAGARGVADLGPVRRRSHTRFACLPDGWTVCLVRVPATALKHLGAHAEWFAAAETVGKVRMYEAVIPRADLEALIFHQDLHLALRHLRPDPGYGVPVLCKGKTHVAILVGNPVLLGLAPHSRPRLVK